MPRMPYGFRFAVIDTKPPNLKPGMVWTAGWFPTRDAAEAFIVDKASADPQAAFRFEIREYPSEKVLDTPAVS